MSTLGIAHYRAVATSAIRESRNGREFAQRARSETGIVSTDITESFQLFQGRVQAEYDRLAAEYGFATVDGTLDIHHQQEIVREQIGKAFDLSYYRERVSR